MIERSIINTDYKRAAHQERLRGRFWAIRADHHWRLRSILLAGGFAVLGVVLAKTSDQPGDAYLNAESAAAEITTADWTNALSGISSAPDLPALTGKPGAGHPPQINTESFAAEDRSEWRRIAVRSGDTASQIFKRLDLHDQFAAVFDVKLAARELRSIHPGQTIRVRTSKRGIEEILYQPRDTDQLHVTRNGDGFDATLESIALDKSVVFASGEITHSLFMAGLDAGLSGTLIMQLAGIFGWDIDFSLDMRQGDRFHVLYEQYQRDGKRLRDGDILAAEFVNQGKTYRAFRYINAHGVVSYYSEDGRSMRKAFLRSPVNFSHISSPFNLSRRHPILNRIRAHRGVDYAAATGTPIIAAGDGRIVFRGVKGGYGRTVILQHGSAYSTLYGHMSRYARGIASGDRVQQGDVIGYVGQSGLATGPHLHYEFRIRGTHHNPVTVRLPGTEPLPTKEKEAFAAAIQPWHARFDTANTSFAAAKIQDE